jgi:thioredoxin
MAPPRTQTEAPAHGANSDVVTLGATTFGPSLDGRPTVVDFFATWCAPCRALEPVFHQAATTHASALRFARVDVDLHPELAARFAVQSVPTLVVFDGEGREMGRSSGARGLRQLEEFLSESTARGARAH